MKKLEFLNLEFTDKLSNNIITENSSFICRFPKTQKHILHSENIHLNGITDILINLGLNIEQEAKRNNQNFDRIYSFIEKRTDLISKLTENLDYIKSQNSQIINELKDIKKELGGKSYLEQNVKYTIKEEDIDKIVSKISKIYLGEEKPKNKLTPYKHWLPRK